MKRVLQALAVATTCVVVPALAQQPSFPKQYPWDQRPRKCLMDPKEFPDILLDPNCRARDWVELERAKHNFGMLIGSGDYDLLERATGEIGYGREKFPTGDYLFEAAYLAIYDNLAWVTRSRPDIGVRFVDGWAKAKGEEGYAKLARAILQYHQAWRARGSGYANTVTAEGWELYRAKLAEASATLDSASPKLKQTGPWHAMKVRLTFEDRRRESERGAVLKAAIAAYPDYVTLYNVPMGLSHPRWGGSYERMEDVAQLALKTTRAEHGAAVYAILYERQFRADCDCTLADAKVDWTTMKQGFRDIEARRAPTAQRLKHYAAMACQMRDKEEARRLYELYDRKVGNVPQGPDAYRLFASR